jgi:RNA polymerase sigma-70 factor (ECF subfamily)
LPPTGATDPTGSSQKGASAGAARACFAPAQEVPLETRRTEQERSPVARDPEVAALCAGDEAAFLALVQRHHAAMVRVALAYVGSRAIAEEAAQEAWLGVVKGISRFEGRSSLKSWIFQILVNCAKSRGVREIRSIPISALAAAEAAEEAPAVDPDRFLDEGIWAGHWSRPPAEWADDRLGTAELAGLVREAIATLPPAQRQVMTLRDVEGWDAAEVCELLQISEGNQRVLLHRARAKVRTAVEERLSGEEAP